MLSMYLADPALAGGVVGGILFSLLTVYELDRTERSRVGMLMDAAVSPLTMALVRLPALAAAAVLGLGLTMLVWLPISRELIGSVFGGTDYLLSYLLFMGLALWLAILAAAAAYQFTRRSDLSLVLFAAFAALSLTVWVGKWQLCWLNPCVWALSDDFSNFRLYRSVAYMRLTWLAALAGVWTLSWLCIRQYGKGLLGSLARSARRVCRPLIALLLLACSGAAYAAQPFFDNSNPDLTASRLFELEYAEGVTCSRRTAQVFPDTAAGTVEGRAAYQFQNTSGQGWTVCFGVDPGYDITSARANGAEISPVRTGYEESNMALWEIALPADGAVELVLEEREIVKQGGRYGAVAGVRRLPQGLEHCGDHPGLPRDQRSLSVPGESEPDALSAQCSARGAGLSHHRGAHRARLHDRHPLRYQRGRGGGDPRQRHRHLAL